MEEEAAGLAERLLSAGSPHALDEASALVVRRAGVQRSLAAHPKLLSHLHRLSRHTTAPDERREAQAWREGESWREASVRLLCALGQFPRVRGWLGQWGRLSRPPLSPDGVRILSLDGGGTRALLTIEMLKAVERASGKRLHELFDVVGGTSTGGVLAAGIQERMPLSTLEALYLRMAKQVFVKTGRPRRYGQLLLTGSTYKAQVLEAILKRTLPPYPCDACGEANGATGWDTPAAHLEASARGASGGGGGQEGAYPTWLERRIEQECEFLRMHADKGGGRPSPYDASPPMHAFVVSSLTSRAPPLPFLLRNYELAPSPPRHWGSSGVPVWQALRATTAAPSYFTEVVLDGGVRGGEEGDQPLNERGGKLVLQDGALLANNPTAIALQEARALYPGVPIACVASFGTGSFAPSEISKPAGWASTVETLVKAATRTEEVHEMLADILPSSSIPYFRFNPNIPTVPLDETSVHKLKELQAVGHDFMSRGDGRDQCNSLAKLLVGRRGAAQRLSSLRARVFSKLGSSMAIARSRL